MMDSTKPLFGGAIRMMIPDNYRDVRFVESTALPISHSSDFRQVPDNQEAFVDADGESSIIIELMEAVETNDLVQCSETHFMELIALNTATDYHITHREVLPNHSLQYVSLIILDAIFFGFYYTYSTPDSSYVILC
jgi:hypothetical protein